MSFAAFIISTGRCGTQWIAAALSNLCSDCITVEHEPLQDRYEARKTLGSFNLKTPLDSLPSDVLSHMQDIEAQLAIQPYIECGHPSWSTIPYLAERFDSRIRIIHLTRHPVPTCCSWLTHSAFQKPILSHIPEKILLSPFDPGTKFKEYCDVWDKLIPFEKCLFYWSEVQAFALEQQARLNVPWLHIRYEDLFKNHAISEILDFLNLPVDDKSLSFQSQRVDKFQYISPVWQDWRIIHTHPRTLSIAETFGYHMNEIDEEQLARRYLMGEQEAF